MDTKGIKRMVLGEKMPDKNDPQYKERYEKDVETGRKFAKWSKLDKLAAKVQQFANNHRTAFLVMVFSFVVLSFAWNIYRLSFVYSHQAPSRTAIERQDSILKHRRQPRVHPIVINNNTKDNEH